MADTPTRTIGPVTTAAGGGVAVAGIICWLVELLAHVEVPTDVQTYIGIVLVLIAGYWVKPARVGEHTA